MIERQNQPQSPVTPSKRDESTHPNIADRIVKTVPATTEIALEMDPVAYQYESWSEMADGWVESLRSSVKTMPDPDHEQIRNVTPLVPLSDVEALIERMVVSKKTIMPHERTDVTRDTAPP